MGTGVRVLVGLLVALGTRVSAGDADGSTVDSASGVLSSSTIIGANVPIGVGVDLRRMLVGSTVVRSQADRTRRLTSPKRIVHAQTARADGRRCGWPRLCRVIQGL